MTLFHFHKWSKWEEFDRKFRDYIEPMSRRNWYGYVKEWTEKWEKRECTICGEKQYRRIKGSLVWHNGEENLNVKGE
jgi:hypothetical protein